MPKAARFLHHLGLVLFLGSIFTFAVASGVPRSGDLAGLLVARKIISAGTTFLTLPGLALLLVSGLTLAAVDRGKLKELWVRVMLVAAILVLGNAALVVLPAVASTTSLAVSSVQAGHLVEGYHSAYVTESVAGGINILLALVAVAAGVWRFGAGSEARIS